MYDDKTLAQYDCLLVDVTGMDKKPTLEPLTINGAGYALDPQAALQRAESGKTDKKYNVLHKITRECVLKIEPLPQFPYEWDPGGSGISKQILSVFYGDNKGCTNKTKHDESADAAPPPGWSPKKKKKPSPEIPDPLYRAWGDAIYSAYPVSDRQQSRTMRATSCGLHCFTVVIRYLRKEGEDKSIYDQMMDDLKSKNAAEDERLKAAAPVLTAAAASVDPTLSEALKNAKRDKTHAVWDPTAAEFFKYWYPAWVVWWIRARENKTATSWTKVNEPLIAPSGVFMWQAFSAYAKARARREGKGSTAGKSKVPKCLEDMGLVMDEGSRHGRVKAAVKEIVGAIDDGYPVILLRLKPSGHFMTIIGYVEDDEGLRFVINDSGGRPIQRFINPYIPHTIVDAPKEAEKQLVNTPSKTVHETGDKSETVNEVSAADGQAALQKQGWHITELVDEVEGKPETISPKRGTDGPTIKVRKFEYRFRWDWRIASEYWSDYWILRYASGKVDKRVLFVKAADPGDAEPLPADPIASP